MEICATCGNESDRTFTVTSSDGREAVFDSVECAVAVIAPACGHCSCRILGHGVEAHGELYCCAHCAETAGQATLVAGHGPGS